MHIKLIEVIDKLARDYCHSNTHSPGKTVTVVDKEVTITSLKRTAE